MALELKKTADSSLTLYVPDLDEHYHSYHGALQEANHVFIKNGIEAINSESVRVLEVGFGTGLNALLTACASDKLGCEINYIGVEAYPVATDLLGKLNYPSLIENYNAGAYYERIVHDRWEKEQKISKTFTLTKIERKIEKCEFDKKFNLIYFDAFGPRVQKEMWSDLNMKKMYDCLQLNGFLVTYCAQGQFKRDLKKVGFKVVSMPGPPGKREMVKAIKNK